MWKKKDKDKDKDKGEGSYHDDSDATNEGNAPRSRRNPFRSRSIGNGKDDSEVSSSRKKSPSPSPKGRSYDSEQEGAPQKRSALNKIRRKLNPRAQGRSPRNSAPPSQREDKSVDSEGDDDVPLVPPIARKKSDSFDSSDGVATGSTTDYYPAADSVAGGSNLQGAIHPAPRRQRRYPPVPADINARSVSFESSPQNDGNVIVRAGDSLSPQPEGQRAQYSSHHGTGSMKRKFRVRPYHWFPEALYLTEEEIYNDSLKPSQEFQHLKSYLEPSSRTTRKVKVSDEVRKKFGSPQDDGRIGSLRVEVLGCVSLARQKPDVSVYIVSGDSAFNTDVIQGYRSPMWPCASRRAAVFPIHHAFAKVFIGVFDVKARMNKETDVFLGRIVIDISSLRPDSEYDVTYPLRASSFVYDRKKRGVLRLRFSLHWFSERAAILSYFTTPNTLVPNCPLVEGSPTIPCTDPKTFRNVALTVHGQDLPGKYSRNAFRATVREYILYQMNLQYLLKATVLDTVLYETPMVSLFLLFASMHCILANSVALVPPYIVGYVLIQYWRSYMHYVSSEDFNFGYKPLTTLEVFKGLISNGKSSNSFKPVMVRKLAKRRNERSSPKLRRINSNEDDEPGDQKKHEIRPMDHREFPFSDRYLYPQFSVEDALAPSSSSKKGGNARLHGRLSVYYSAAPPTQAAEGPNANDDDDDESSEDSGGDDETVSGMGDSMFDMDEDDDDDDDDDEDEMMPPVISSSRETKRFKPGPPQAVDIKGKKIPPQVHLKKMENIFHKLSRGVSVELVHPPHDMMDPDGNESTDGTASGAPEAKKKQQVRDEFDKLLGLHTRSANPMVRILSTFLGPLMRCMRVAVYIFRVGFNVSAWRDPYLSFWVFVTISAFLVFLIVFPWRSFFFVLTVLCLGPQNILLRKYLEKKAREKAEEEKNELDNGYGYKRVSSRGSGEEMSTKSGDGTKGFFRKKLKARMRRGGSNDQFDLLDLESDRPPFSSHLHGQTGSGKKLQPRSVCIPYSRLPKGRFFDWPPDPTVSRVTPMAMLTDSLSPGGSIPDYTPSESAEQQIPQASIQRDVRRRRGSNQDSAIANVANAVMRRRGST